MLWKKQAQVVGHALEKAIGSSNLVAQALNSKKVTLCFGKSLGHALEKAKGTHTQNLGKACGFWKNLIPVALEKALAWLQWSSPLVEWCFGKSKPK